ncbi:hypothetical protein A2863_03915 [Candidatus Woesebacteria bacterium RIFCSPHIGHO2_01_FULL_38_9b]|uniref:DUF4352 domain-containing protein n=1 Tax=Candidatus Woesebacteria bacterium RIFCSPHIGHO2_01_FULL_38_9b TaxID=1802493 RepID=A0A1F7Y539_9BACT|nr:MAG: hypothetical protein A2863_03915 [Candidatus Woesebacteria bacterium RIFCSPHIGHO2_01_FULL_38_9b]
MGVRQITLSIPVIEKQSIFGKYNELVEYISSLKLTLSSYLHSFITQIKERKEKRNSINSDASQNNKFRSSVNNYKKFIKPLLLVVFFVVFIFGIAKFVSLTDSNSSGSNKVEVEKAKATQDINKEYIFPLRDAEGNELGTIKYLIEKAELMDQIIVQGQKATTVKGRTFLIITLKITNEYTQAIDMDTKDYVRLSVEPNQEWLAPDIHNDPVEVQAISTKYTRLGFPINESDNNLILRVGEINGTKEEIPLQLK